MQIGKMRDIVEVYGKSVDTADGWNGDPDEKTEFLTQAWANINPEWGRRFFSSATENMERSDVIIVRYCPVFTPDKLLMYNGKFHKITAMKDIDNRHTYIAMKCEVLENG